MGKAEFIMPSLNDIDKMLSKLAKMIKRSGFKPDILIGVSRGGLIPLAILSDKLGVESEIVGVKYYCGVKETKEKPEITQPILSNLSGKKVLVIDDVADIGHSLQLVKKYVQERGVKEVRLCTLHYKPWSVVKPEYFVEETEAWIIYPWEVKETLTNLFKKLKEKGLKISEAKDEIEKKGIPKQVIEEFLRENVTTA
ncbi:MAG: phosphoribosyltransferase [archaeon]|nr:phosphoribosyltransferase [archaeon]MCP8313737.1 phosphoribosyltransferase [archaeon]